MTLERTTMTATALCDPLRAMIARGEELLQETAGAWRVDYVLSDPPLIRVFDDMGRVIHQEEVTEE